MSVLFQTRENMSGIAIDCELCEAYIEDGEEIVETQEGIFCCHDCGENQREIHDGKLPVGDIDGLSKKRESVKVILSDMMF